MLSSQNFIQINTFLGNEKRTFPTSSYISFHFMTCILYGRTHKNNKCSFGYNSFMSSASKRINVNMPENE